MSVCLFFYFFFTLLTFIYTNGMSFYFLPFFSILTNIFRFYPYLKTQGALEWATMTKTAQTTPDASFGAKVCFLFLPFFSILTNIFRFYMYLKVTRSVRMGDDD
jgi:hypothetical protein